MQTATRPALQRTVTNHLANAEQIALRMATTSTGLDAVEWRIAALLIGFARTANESQEDR